MFRRVLPLLLLLAALFLEISALPFLTDSALLPPFTLLTVSVLGLLLGRTRGALYGMIAGVLSDVLVLTPIGMMTAVFTISGYLSGVAGRRFQRYALTPVVTPLVCLIGCEVAQALYAYMAGAAIGGRQALYALARAAIGVGVAQATYLLFNRMLKPKWSRYAAR